MFLYRWLESQPSAISEGELILGHNATFQDLGDKTSPLMVPGSMRSSVANKGAEQGHKTEDQYTKTNHITMFY